MEKYMTADARNPYMGPDNKICQTPAFWCRLHQVWLSKEDAERKKCRNRLDYNMIGTHRCPNLEKRERG